MKSLASKALLGTLLLTLGCSPASHDTTGAGTGNAGIGAAGAGSGGGAGSTGAAGSDASAAAGSDGGAAAGSDGGVPDAPEATAFKGRHAFTVQSTLVVVPTLFTADAVPKSHAFTLILDGDTGLAIAGSPDGLNAQPFKTSDGRTFEIGPLGFAFPDRCVESLLYTSATVTVSPTGVLTGVGKGTASWSVTDERTGGTVTMTLAGVPDEDPPSLAAVTHFDPTDPFFRVSLVASEPLPPDTALVLYSSSGDPLPLAPSTSAADARALETFKMPDVLLRFGETYSIPTSQIVDFAGRQAQAQFQLTTRAQPPLAAEDGFESAPAQSFEGASVVTSGQGYPVIAGAKSVYVPGRAAGPGVGSLLTLRLAVQPGDKVIRFSYRTVDTTAGGFAWPARFALASVGKPIITKEVATSNTPATAFKMPGGSTVQLGPVSSGEITLPADVTDEVVLDLISGSFLGCGAFYSTMPGLIIDDLRVE